MARADLGALFIAILALTPCKAALAAEPLPALVVTRAPGANDCPDADKLAREVARLNGRPSLDPTASCIMPSVEPFERIYREHFRFVWRSLRRLAFAALEVARTEFAQGMLSEEREALTIELLAKSGQREAARARAAAFLRAFPRSAHGERVRGFAE